MTFCWLTSNVLSTLLYLLIVAYAVSISRAPCDYLGSPLLKKLLGSRLLCVCGNKGDSSEMKRKKTKMARF